MKGLERIPSQEELGEAYHRLQGRTAVSETVLALWSQWSRFDPRLAEQLVAFFYLHWRELSPVKLCEAVSAQPWPASLGALLEFVALKERSKLFLCWSACALSGAWLEVNAPAYFIGLRRLAGRLMLEDVERSIKPYRRWGFSGREILWNKAHSDPDLSKRTFFSKELRLRVLRDLGKGGRRFQVADYLRAVGNCVSRRQAERDVKSVLGLRKTGGTRGAYYRLGRSR